MTQRGGCRQSPFRVGADAPFAATSDREGSPSLSKLGLNDAQAIGLPDVVARERRAQTTAVPDDSPLTQRQVGLWRALHDLTAPAYIVDRQGRFGWMNSAAVELLGRRYGQPMLEVVDRPHRATVRENFVRKLVGKGNSSAEVCLLDVRGRRQLVCANSAPIHDGRRVTGVLVIVVPLRAPEPEASPLSRKVTPRQQQVLQLLGDGLATDEIACRLGVVPATARNHIRDLFRALGVHSRLEAVIAGRRHGLLNPV